MLTIDLVRIIRVTLLLPAFCLISFGCIFMNLNFVYLKSWVNIYEAIAMCAFLALVCTFISPRRDQQESYFDSLELRSKKGEAVPGGSLTWFKVGPPSEEQRVEQYSLPRDSELGSVSINIHLWLSFAPSLPMLHKRRGYIVSLLTASILRIFGLAKSSISANSGPYYCRTDFGPVEYC